LHDLGAVLPAHVVAIVEDAAIDSRETVRWSVPGTAPYRDISTQRFGRSREDLVVKPLKAALALSDESSVQSYRSRRRSRPLKLGL
jgi:hypothetical protein